MPEMKRYSREELLPLSKEFSGQIFIDLGCGERKKQGYIGVDIFNAGGVDVLFDLSHGLPFEDNIIDGVYSNFFFEHVPNTIYLFQEVYRVCKHGATVEFCVPHYQSFTQYKDPTHKAIIPLEMVRYFSDEKWYGSDYGINTNFKVINVQYAYLPPFRTLTSKWLFPLWPITYPIVLFARRFLWNVVHSMTIKLKVIK